MPSRTELVAHGKTTEEVAEAIGADLVIFQSLPDLISACRQFNPKIEKFDCSVFNGEYVTGGVDEEYMTHLENMRSDHLKNRGIVEQTNGLPPSGNTRNKSGGGLNGISKSPIILPPGLPSSNIKRPQESRGSSEGSAVGMENEIKLSGPVLDDTVGLHNTWSGDR
jgi:amidophosphoribosyltransferase